MKLKHFSDLGLSEALLKALAGEGYETPTPIQAKAIPPLLAGRDMVGIARTGTGKTAAFALPLLQRLAAHPARPRPGECRALILSPTRELAAQIGESIAAYGRYLHLASATVYGGVSIGAQLRTLKSGVDILVATPGRLVDLIERRALTLAKVEIFVLDEVDQMLDLGFIHAIRRITGLLPRHRQNLFFSATMPKEIAALAAGLLTDPVRVEVTPPATTAESVEQRVVHVHLQDKLRALVGLLADRSMLRTLVFTRTKRGADKVTRGLNAAGIEATAIHGNKSQAQRERALGGFKNGRIRVLVATDIAARGIDVDAVSHVVNHDLPHVPEAYVHRIGRTARAGAAGIAISLCDHEQRPLLRAIERLIGKSIDVVGSPVAAVQEARDHEPRDRKSTAPRHRQAPRRDHAGSSAGTSWMKAVGERPANPDRPAGAAGKRRRGRRRIKGGNSGGQRFAGRNGTRAAGQTL